MENIIQTIDPQWVYNTALSEYINTGSGECISPQEFAEIMHTRVHPAEVGVLKRAPTLSRLESMKEAFLNLKEAFILGNKWEDDVNPNMEVGETGTGYWTQHFGPGKVGIEKHSPKGPQHFYERPDEAKFVHQAGCSNKIHPIENENPDFHKKQPVIAEMIDTMYQLIDNIIYQYFHLGTVPDIGEYNTIITMMLDGIKLKTIEVFDEDINLPGDNGRSGILSQLDNCHNRIKSLVIREQNDTDRFAKLSSRMTQLEEELSSAKKVKTWLWDQVELKDRKIDLLVKELSKSAQVKSKLRAQLYKSTSVEKKG